MADTPVEPREAGTTELPMYMRDGRWFVELDVDEYRRLARRAALATPAPEAALTEAHDERHVWAYREHRLYGAGGRRG